MGIADGINFVSYCTNINTVTQNNGFEIGGIIGLNSLESKVFIAQIVDKLMQIALKKKQEIL